MGIFIGVYQGGIALGGLVGGMAATIAGMDATIALAGFAAIFIGVLVRLRVPRPSQRVEDGPSG